MHAHALVLNESVQMPEPSGREALELCPCSFSGRALLLSSRLKRGIPAAVRASLLGCSLGVSAADTSTRDSGVRRPPAHATEGEG